MSPELQNTIINVAMLGLSLVILGGLVATGLLREKKLALGPDRDLGLDGAVYLQGFFAVACYVGLMVSFGGLEGNPAGLVLSLLPFAIIGLLIAGARQVPGGLRKVGLAPRRPLRDLGWAAAVVPIAFILAGASGIITTELSAWAGYETSPIGHEKLKELHEDETGELLMAVIIGAVILAPLMEEPVFRGLLQTCLLNLFGSRRWPALLITAALFSITHYWVVPWQNLVPLFVLGLVFGYVYERTGSLLTPVLVHAGFNAINIAIVVAMPPPS